MHEIITLQLGQRSNHLATHFWNTQESYFTYSADQESLIEHDIHFRSGVGADGTETFTPRTVIYDLKGGFGSLRRFNALYDTTVDSNPAGLWGGATVIQRDAPIEPHVYQQHLEEGLPPARLYKDSVRYWSDFNRVYFHPRSIVQLNEYELNSSLMPFEQWDAGDDLFSSLDKDHDLLDRDLRPFVEEADQMQGFQVMTGADDAWGGFASRYVERIRDEYGKTAVWVWAEEEDLKSVPREKQALKLSNTARSLAEISVQASQYIPLSIPSSMLPTYVAPFDRHSLWHTSALFSTALESMTLTTRIKPQNSQRQTLDEIAMALNANGNQNIAKLQMSVSKGSTEPPMATGHAPVVNGQSQDSRLPSSADRMDVDEEGKDATPSTLDLDFSPSNDFAGILSRGPQRRKRYHLFGEAEAGRGNDDEFLGTKDEDEMSERRGHDGRERARRRAAGLPIIQKTRTPLSFSLLDSFPQIYSNATAVSDASSTSVSVRTSLSTDTTVADRVRSLRTVISRTVAVDEREALSNSLASIAEGYEEGWDSGSDEDDDDY